MKRLFRISLLIALLAMLVSGTILVWVDQCVLRQPLQLTADRTIDVAPGSTPGGALIRLENEGVLHGSFWLRLYWRYRMAEVNLHSGEYLLQPGMTASDILRLWQDGEVIQYPLTLVEGWDFRQLRQALASQKKLVQTLTDMTDEQIMAALGKAGEHPEGRFFPDTYRFVQGSRDIDILKQAYQRLETILAEEWAGRAQNLPYENAYQALIMASLIEKETGVSRERSEIAGVFVRRLQKGMLLQTDPTVIYGMGERYNGRIRRSDLLENTPYNTYVIAGLPPTPIAMAGREAIHAALHPAEGNTLYFVARGDGSHVFSPSLEAHNRAVRQYQLKRRADYRSSPAPASAPDKEQQP